MGNRDRERTRIGSGDGEHESLLIHENTPKYVRNKHLCVEQGLYLPVCLLSLRLFVIEGLNFFFLIKFFNYCL